MKSCFLGIITILFLLSVSCSGEHEDKILAQDRLIEQFINYIDGTTSGIDVDTIVFNEGVNRLVIQRGDEDRKVEQGDSVYVYFVAYVITGSSSFYVYETNIREAAVSSGLDTETRDFLPLKIRVGNGDVIRGVDLGLQMCYAYENSFLVFNSDLAYGNNAVGVVPEYSPVFFEVYIIQLIKN